MEHRQFTMSMFLTAEDLYKAKAEYYQEVTAKLEKLCDAQFLEPMFQPYAGANSECFFCGASEGRGRETEHTETCPFLTYKNIIDS